MTLDPASATPVDRRRWLRPAGALVLGFALMSALLLAGCSNSGVPESPAAPGNPAAAESPATSSSPPGPSSSAPPPSAPATASSIEDAVTDASQLLTELDQEFKED